MAGANSNIQITDLDFSSIKTNFINYLQSQSTFQDYNFEGSGLNVLLDVLAYNTQYNAFYLNMVANEMFLDTATQRASIISQAKVLNYTPQSAIAPTAFINVVFNGVTTSSFTLPAYTPFLSSAINGVNYNFLTTDSYTVNVSSNTAIFPSVEIKQGTSGFYSYVVDSTTNPSYTFEIPDATIDTTSLQVVVQQSQSNGSYQIFNLATSGLQLNSTSQVYFLQESLTGTYEIYFGDGVLGQQLTDGNIVRISYISTEGTSGAGANSFQMLSAINGYYPSAIYPISAASSGSDKESITSIKFQAPKSFAAQGRAVTKNDYITAIQQNNLGFPVDAVSVWGGEENSTPIYGQVFIAIKPTGSYVLTQAQKQRLISEVIQPISVLTVTPTIVDPDYTYLQINSNVLYDPVLTTLTSSQLQSSITTAIQNYGITNLNTFNATFSSYQILSAINNTDPSILSSEFSLNLQKKIFPLLTGSSTINLYYNTSLLPGKFGSGITSTPAMQFLNPANLSEVIDGVFLEEVPSSTYGVDTISVINPGFGYTATPTVTILGDGTGANATATIVNGSIQSITVTNSGNNYTQAIVTITPATGDTTGQLGAAVVNLQGRYGTLRTYYNNIKNVKTILNSNVGTIDYLNGILTLNDFNPYNVGNPLGQLTISVTPTTDIVSSSFDRIITIDPYDSTAINVNITAKSST